MAQTRKQREASRVQDVKMYALLFSVGLVFLLVWHSPWGVPFIAGVAALILLDRSRARSRKEGLLALGVRDLSALKWEQLEELVQLLFREKGYAAQLTPNGADFGADLVLKKAGTKAVVQVKHWEERDVGVRAVQEVVAAKAHYGATEALAVSTGYFTAKAIQLAKSNRVELWDRPRLERELGALRPGGRQPTPLAAATGAEPGPEPADSAVSCPRCGSPMLERNGRRGPFWGCSAFPKCRGSLPL